MIRRPRSVHYDRLPAPREGLSRRDFLAAGAGAMAVGVAGPARAGGLRRRAAPDSALAADEGHRAAALAALGRTALRHPLSRPFPDQPAGKDMLPGIEHIVVLMLENHSYDNFFGMLGRGDGYTLDAHGRPTAWNAYADGRMQRAFRMPSTCQLSGKPSQEWKASHEQYAEGALSGFVQSASGPVAMGYWGREDLPFTYALASHFPVGDRWFCSLLGQTDPNRRYLIAGTSAGMVDDIGSGPGNLIPDLGLLLPAHGTVFDLLGAHGISWADYCASFPLGATAELYPIDDLRMLAAKKTIDDFFADAKAGTLPAFSIIDPDYGTQSQEDPQNVAVGEQFLEQAVRALGASPAWEKTLLVFTYDEHGGYYDHVAPPPALAPDLIGPMVQPGEQLYEGFRRYGFRVPAVVVSAYAKRDYVSHMLYDHTSVLALLQRKWNLPALTYRDANANDLTDFLDLDALAAGAPTFPALPTLPPSGLNAGTQACSGKGPGQVPPQGSIGFF